MTWQPKTYLRFERAVETSTGVALIVTDAGKAYIKALGNPEGPHVLACEWVGTQLAGLLGVPTPECAILTVRPEDEIPLGHGRQALPGPAFVSRALAGYTWSGGEKDLRRVENVEVVSRLVVFDTWVLNVDRCPPPGVRWRPNPDNVFLTSEGARPRRVRLVALDQAHSFTGGRELTERLAHVDRVKDQRVYGFFPAFAPFVRGQEVEAAAGSLRRLDTAAVEAIISGVPVEWEVANRVRSAWLDFLCRRAAFLAENIDKVRWPGLLPGIGPV